MTEPRNKKYKCSDEIVDEGDFLKGEIKASTVSSTFSVSSTTLQELPLEVLDYILMKTVVKKVVDKKLAKPAWIGCASRLIEPMRTVCLQWNYRLATNWFKIVLSRTLNSKVPTTISVERISTSPHITTIVRFAKLGNLIYYLAGYPQEETFLQCRDSCCLTASDVNDIGEFCGEGIFLPGVVRPHRMAACKRSNSIYVWQFYGRAAVWRLIPDGKDGCEVLRWTDYYPTSDYSRIFHRIVFLNLSVLDDGSLLAARGIRYKNKETETFLTMHKPDGSVIRNTMLDLDIRSKLSWERHTMSNVMMKSNGNLIYSEIVRPREILFKEIDQDGNDIRKFHWLHKCDNCLPWPKLFLDSYDRVILQHNPCRLAFLDAELNFLEDVQIEDPEENPTRNKAVECTVFDKETNEMIVMYHEWRVLFLQLTS